MSELSLGSLLFFVIKKLFKSLSGNIHEQLSHTEYYHKLTEKVIEKISTAETVCVDIGANEGRILQLFTTYSPKAVHIAYEPVPNFYFGLKRKFASAAKIYKTAVGNSTGSSTFNLVSSNPSLSGLKKTLLSSLEKSEAIKLNVAKLDDLLEQEEKPGILKIEASGGEYHVLLGAKKVIEEAKPKILFSFSKTSTDAYNVTAEQMHQLLEDYGYTINVLSRFLSDLPPIPFIAFKAHHIAGDEDLFIAVPK